VTLFPFVFYLIHRVSTSPRFKDLNLGCLPLNQIWGGFGVFFTCQKVCPVWGVLLAVLCVLCVCFWGCFGVVFGVFLTLHPGTFHWFWGFCPVITYVFGWFLGCFFSPSANLGLYLGWFWYTLVLCFVVLGCCVFCRIGRQCWPQGVWDVFC